MCFHERSAENPWDVALDLFSIRAVEGDGNVPVLVLTCPDCGCTGLYNAKTMGLVE